jgi:hypothetical protein
MNHKGTKNIKKAGKSVIQTWDVLHIVRFRLLVGCHACWQTIAPAANSYSFSFVSFVPWWFSVWKLY